MSLSVYILPKEKNFNTDSIKNEIQYPCNELFGFEVCRKELWGHQLIKDLGCDLVYSLREDDIVAADMDMIKLKNEFLKMLDNIDLIEKQTNYKKRFIEFRIRNALEAIRVAEKYRDKVYIVIS